MYLNIINPTIESLDHSSQFNSILNEVKIFIHGLDHKINKFNKFYDNKYKSHTQNDYERIFNYLAKANESIDKYSS